MALSALEIGKRALAASQVALDLTSNNIANVNTDGYSRRTAVISETDPYQSSNGFVGTGAIVDKIKNYREEFFDKEIRSTGSRQSAFDNDSNVLKRIEGILAEPSDLGLNEVSAKFFNAFQELSLKPEDMSLRQNLLMVAQDMVERFQTTAKQFSDLKSEIALSANNDTAKANQLLKEIAGLNGEVQKAVSYDSVGAQTYIDAREKKLEDLSKLTDITVTNGEVGTVNVFINGTNVVTGVDFGKLNIKEKINPATGEHTLQLTKSNPQNASETIVKVGEGELGSYLTHYNQTLNNNASDSVFSISRNLDNFVDAIVKKVNGVTQTGFGLDDKTSPAAGRNFFEPGNTSAATIQISNDIKDKPRTIPLSSAPNEPGDSTVARKIALLSTDKTFLDNQTPSEYFSNTLGQLGQLSQSAQNGSSTTATVSEQLKNQRESIIGVNLDEEAINLIKYQKSFEAASRVINIQSSMLTTLVNLGR